MAKQYYECHITMLDKVPSYVKEIVELHKWKFSAIDGDPSLGNGIKLYATRHFNAKIGADRIIEELQYIAKQISDMGIKVIRRKVENVIYDDRIETVNCNGGCPECHLDD
jgi:ribosomal 50S subunit-associated protein YjgA (DUF615 family)